MPKTFTICILCTFLCILAGCKKDTLPNQTSTPTPSLRNQLFGAWELSRTYGGLSDAHYSPGSGNLLLFNGNAFTEYSTMSIAKRGSYEIISDNSASETVCKLLPEGQFENRIVYDNDFFGQKVFFQINNDTLTLVSGCFTLGAGNFVDYIRRP